MLSLNRTVAVGLGYWLIPGIVLAAASVEDSWEVTTVDASANVGMYSSIAVLPSGQPAISYFDHTNRTLKYAWKDGDGWHASTVDAGGEVGDYTCLAILPSGDPAISYHDIAQDDLKYAWLTEHGWRTTIVDGAEGGFTGAIGTSLAVLPSGNPAISYRDHWNGWLKYAWFDGNAWNTTVVDSSGNVGHHSSLAILHSGQPAISYLDYANDRLMYAWFDGSVWHTDVAAEPGGTNTCLRILPSGYPAIVHNATGGVRYVWFDGSLWQSTRVDSVSGWESWFGCPGLALQPSGDPALCYVRRQYPYSPELIYAWFQGASWHTTAITVGGGGESSLVFLPNGQPAISFYDYDSMKYATRPSLPGDVDGDGDVDLNDLADLLACYGECVGDTHYNPAADFDGSGCVDLADLAALLANYGD